MFDLDGTLFDSLGVWAEIDRIFFKQNGLEIPADYAACISGLSFLQTAQYTKDHFGFHQSAEEIANTWQRMCRKEYANHVPLKPGAAEYLQKLKENGVRLAVVTTLTKELYEPALKRNGIFSLFDAFTTTDESGQHKKTGEIYKLPAAKLETEPIDCAVFEDIYEGIQGAKNAGMLGCLVYDRHNASRIDAAKQICDYYIETFEELHLWI